MIMRRLSSLAVLAALVSLPLGGAAAWPATPHAAAWSVVPSPNPPAPAGGSQGASLNGVACPTSTSCVVVGGYRDSSALPLVGQSSGANWSIVAAPQPASHKNPSGQLSTVACAARTRCFGVGFYNNGASTRALVEQWNGSTWSIVPNPKMPGFTKSSLSGIACPASTSCYAVGYMNGASAGPKTFIEHWNGAGWSVVKSANPPGGGQLSGITCSTNASCVAVGLSNGPVYKTLVERWNGAAWSVVASPNPVNAPTSVLSAVSCPTPKACFAVGYYYGRRLDSPTTLTLRSNGDTWSIVTTPDGPRFGSGVGSGLAGITCLSVTKCFAVGYYQNNYASNPRLMRWDGKSWSRVTIPHASPFSSTSLSGITCASVTACVVVGTGVYGTLIAKWNGTTWSEVPAGGSASALSSVSCPSATMCVAVGGSAPGFKYYSDNAALIEQWNGSSWKVVAAPGPADAGAFAHLSSVSCATTTSCFAVGATSPHGPGSELTMLIEHWDGAQWSLVAVPNPPDFSDAELTAVSCGSLTSCFAIGDGQGSSSTTTFFERWNGTAWSPGLFPVPAGVTTAGLLGISCTSASACVAVGGSNTRGAAGTTLVEEWDGVTWSVDASPNDPTATNTWLTSVTCPAVDRCYAVGTHFNSGDSTAGTLVEQWDGTAWSIVPSANPAGAYFSQLAGIACLTTTSCFAVGTAFQNGGGNTALVERWDGTSWSPAQVAAPAGARASVLSGITCGNGSCTAVGAYETAVARRTLVERYS